MPHILNKKKHYKMVNKQPIEKKKIYIKKMHPKPILHKVFPNVDGIDSKTVREEQESPIFSRKSA